MVTQGLPPCQVPVAANDAIRRSKFKGFLRIESCVNASEYNKCLTSTRQSTKVVPAKGIPSVDAYAHYVARLDGIKVQ
jgi:hypothetical protein